MNQIVWDLDGIKNKDKVCWEYTDEPLKIDPDASWNEIGNGSYVRMNPKTHALIESTKDLHLSSLTQTNLNEWKYRLDSLFDAGVSFLFSDATEGEVPIRLRFSDLSLHIGLKTSASTWTKERFDSSIRELRMTRQLGSLDMET
jgi:hypothetical protein